MIAPGPSPLVRRLVPVLVALLVVLAAPAGAQTIQNGDFSAGLAGWTVQVDGPVAGAGGVTVTGLGAQLDEGTSFLVRLSQTFTVPSTAFELGFDLFEVPGFSLGNTFIPDAFEVALLDGDGDPVVPTWAPFATSFFNLQESGAVNLGAGVGFDGVRVTLPLDAALFGQTVELVFQLVGADLDVGSGVTVAAVAVEVLCEDPFGVTHYGSGLAGTFGVPTLDLDAPPVPGTTVGLQLSNVSGQETTGCLIIAPAPASIGFSGLVGTFLVDLAAPTTTVIDYAMPAGGLTLAFTLPFSMDLCGLSAYLQNLHFDLSAPSGHAFTDGLEIVFGADVLL